MCSMSTLVNSGTMSVLKLMAMGDTSSTLSCDTARTVSRESVRSPWKAGSNFEQHGHGAVVDQRGGRHSVPGELDPRPRQGRSTTAPPAPPPVAAAKAAAASSSGNVAAVETPSFPVASSSASSPSARPSGCTITDFEDTAAVARALNDFERHYNQIAQPFEWNFTRDKLAALFDRLEDRQA